MKGVNISFDGDETLQNIENEHDRVLLEEAILALQGRALRAAYEMTCFEVYIVDNNILLIPSCV